MKPAIISKCWQGSLIPTASFAMVVLLAVTVGLGSAAGATSPAGKVFFTIVNSLDTSAPWEPLCLRFTATKVCDEGDYFEDGGCGSWFYTEQRNSESEVSIIFGDDDDGNPTRFESRVRINTRGKKDALGGAGRVVAGNKSLNFGLAGQSTSRGKCQRLIRDFYNDPVARTPSCMERAVFGDAEESLYILPYPVGKKYPILTSYCQRPGGHDRSLAYDFAMPFDSEVVAARSGTVQFIWEGTDDPKDDRFNGLNIEHDDGTIAVYAHLAYNGALVELGDRVEQGQVIAITGDSGLGEGGVPHLHFQVYRHEPVYLDDVPVNFRNARGRLDERGGLMWGYRYKALPY